MRLLRTRSRSVQTALRRPDTPAFSETPSHRLAFTLLELLVTLSIIGLLTTLLAPAILQGKTAAKMAACRHNLRQLAQILHMYATDQGGYPVVWDNPSLKNFHSWAQTLDVYVGRSRSIETYSWIGPQINPEQPASVFRCPVLSVPRRTEYEASLNPPQYQFNVSGVNIMAHYSPKITLGLGGRSDSSNLFVLPTPESAVVSPGEMISLGDAPNRSERPREDGWYCDALTLWAPVPESHPGFRITEQFTQMRVAGLSSHSSRFNRAFCDGHVELEDFRRTFNPTDSYLRRWNLDNEAHADVWRLGAGTNEE